MSEFTTFADYQKYNFFREPDWRWDRVISICQRQPTVGRCTRRDDEYIRGGHGFYLKYNNRPEGERERLFWENPGLYYAHDLFLASETYGRLRAGALCLQARLLARQTPEEICKVMGIAPQTVEWYEKLFFNVNEFIDQRDWVTNQILVPALMRSMPFDPDDDEDNRHLEIVSPFLDGSLKMFAYFGGPALVDVLVSGFRPNMPAPGADGVADWLDQAWVTVLRRRSIQAALRFEINKYNVMQLFDAHTRILELEHSEESQAKKRSEYEHCVRSLLDELPWCGGQAGEEQYRNKLIGRFDQMPTELRDDEALRVAAGEQVERLNENWPEGLPPARPQQATLGTTEPEL